MRQTMWMVVAVLLGAQSAGAVALLQGTEPTPAGACSATEGTWGFGGSHVECGPLRCGKGSATWVYAYAFDNVAVSAGAACPSAVAQCQAPKTCTDVSKGAASAEGNATCVADTDEWWDSGVMVACAVTPGVAGDGGVDVKRTICRLVPDFPGCKATTPYVDYAGILAACAGTAAGAVSHLTPHDLVPEALGSRLVSGLVSARVLPDHTLVVLRFDGHDGSCTLTETHDA